MKRFEPGGETSAEEGRGRAAKRQEVADFIRLRSPGGREHSVSTARGAQAAFIEAQMPGRPEDQQLTPRELSKLMRGEAKTSHGWSRVEDAPVPSKHQEVADFIRLRSPGGHEHSVSTARGAQTAFVEAQMPGRPKDQQLVPRD